MFIFTVYIRLDEKMFSKKLVHTIMCLLIIGPITTTLSTEGMENFLEVRTRHYRVLTRDFRIVNVYEYYNIYGKKEVPVIFIHGWTENHLIFDLSAKIRDRSIAKYLAEDMRDVWVVDLRTHDTDGDPGTALENEEKMIKYWDFDKTYVKKDMVEVINFIKRKTGKNKFVLSGHSMGGSISIAYAELIGQENIAGIITFASPGKPTPSPPEFTLLRDIYCDECGHVRLGAPVNFDPNNHRLMKLMLADMATYDEGNATEWWLIWYYAGTLNDEPAGVNCDLLWGMDSNLHENWLDPDGYDYTAHLPDVVVPFLSIVGSQDEMVDPAAVNALCDEGMIGSSDKTCLEFTNYGHVDILIGKNAPSEIFQVVKEWLNTRFS